MLIQLTVDFGVRHFVVYKSIGIDLKRGLSNIKLCYTVHQDCEKVRGSRREMNGLVPLPFRHLLDSNLVKGWVVSPFHTGSYGSI